MNIVDIVLALIIIIAITIGYCRGFLASIIKIAAFVCSLIATKLFHTEMVGIVKEIQFIKNFVDTGVRIIVEKFGFQSIELLPGETLNNLDTASGVGSEYIQNLISTIQKFIGDAWLTQAENVGEAMGEMLYSIIAYLILLLGTFLVVLIVGNIIIKIIHSNVVLKGTDMILGAVFTGGIALVLMFITVKVITPFIIAVDNASLVSAVESSRVVEFILNFLA